MLKKQENKLEILAIAMEGFDGTTRHNCDDK